MKPRIDRIERNPVRRSKVTRLPTAPPDEPGSTVARCPVVELRDGEINFCGLPAGHGRFTHSERHLAFRLVTGEWHPWSSWNHDDTMTLVAGTQLTRALLASGGDAYYGGFVAGSPAPGITRSTT